MKSFLNKFPGTVLASLVFIILLVVVFIIRIFTHSYVLESELLLSLSTDDVVFLHLRAQDSVINLGKDNNDWYLIEGERYFRADNNKINDMLEPLALLKIDKDLGVDNIFTGDFGIENPAADITVHTNDTESRIVIGDSIPIGEGRYIYYEGDGRLIASSTDVSALLAVSTESIRDQRIIGIDPGSVDRIEIRVGNFEMEMKKSDGTWTSTGLVEGAYIDQIGVQHLLSIFAEVRASGIEDEDPKNLRPYGFRSPMAVVKLGDGGETFEILFGKRKDETSYFLKTSEQNTVYTVHKDVFKLVPKNIDSLVIYR